MIELGQPHVFFFFFRTSCETCTCYSYCVYTAMSMWSLAYFHLALPTRIGV